jgi:tyrosyl-tRNA synthetase
MREWIKGKFTCVHHSLLPGLSKPSDENDSHGLGKMSKSDPNSGIFIHNTDEEIRTKIKKAWCEEANIENNPLLEISKNVIFHEFDVMKVERPEKFGGNVDYTDYNQLESDFAAKKLHPTDLKQTVGNYLVKVVSPIRDNLNLNDDLFDAIKNSH